MQSQAFHAKHGHWSEELEELRRSWERRCSVVLARQEEAELAGTRLKTNTTFENKNLHNSYTRKITLCLFAGELPLSLGSEYINVFASVFFCFGPYSCLLLDCHVSPVHVLFYNC